MTEDVLSSDYSRLLELEQRKREAMHVELARIGIDSASMNYGQMTAALKATSNGGLAAVPLSRYERKAVQWLRQPFFQGAAFHLLAGKKGQCKGTFVAGLAARVTTAKMYAEPRRVLVVTSEDSVSLDFGPRFDAADGNDALCHVVEGDFRLPRDVSWLEGKAQELGDVGLIVVDPIGNHLSDTNTDGEGSVRAAIAPLNRLADRLNCMVFGVRHLGKDIGRGALSSVLGSTAWVDVPRCVIIMARDDEDEMLFHAQVVAGNRAPVNAALGFRLQIVDVGVARGITVLDGTGESGKNVDDLLANGSAKPSSRSQEAKERILDLLEGGKPMPSDELDATVAEEFGLKATTVRNIRGELKDAGLVRAIPEKDEKGVVLRWMVARTLAKRPQTPQAPASLGGDVAPGHSLSPDHLQSVYRGQGEVDSERWGYLFSLDGAA